MNTPERQQTLLRWLVAATVVVGAAIAVLTVKVFQPLIYGRAAAAEGEQKVELPAYDYAAWHGLPVLYEGRIKPFASACEEAVRHVTGRARFQGNDPVALVLAWQMLRGGRSADGSLDWEKYPFILCDHRGLREAVYAEQLAGDPATPEEARQREERLHGKYVAPDDLRRSEAFKKLLDEVEEIEAKDREKATQLMSPEQRKAGEVAGRLALFDGISQNNPPSYFGIARRQHQEDKMLLVALDKVPGSGWFSVGQLRDCLVEVEQAKDARGREQPDTWQRVMRDRLSRTPQLYINPERRKALEEFQNEIKAGTAGRAIDELAEVMKGRREKQLATRAGQGVALQEVALTRSDLYHRRLAALVAEARKKGDGSTEAEIVAELRKVCAEQDGQTIADLRLRLAKAAVKYHPDDPRFRMLHLNYLEARYPDLYPDSAAWQKFPADDARRVVAAHDAAAAAYKAGDPGRFDQAAGDYFAVLRQVSEQVGAYPGVDGVGDRVKGILTGAMPGSPGTPLLDLEMTFDRVQPFRWAWVLMLGATLLLAASMVLHARLGYWLGLATVGGSLAFQLFGFFTRIVIAGRPPVSNMYETVIWVAFMSSVFALALELVYRRTVIVFAGALAATLGLVLADQLPLVLDPKISALEPVLRSNYWLTIHVLTIVSSYAGGTVAWALGNLALALIVFGKPRDEVVRTLSQFTYKAMQIAVLLLAAGTFLGGWWAAESWGRFWGWDPKEVWALIALVCYVIPLHARYIGWVKHFGLAVSAVVCYAAIVMSWYGVNFVLGAGLHSYGFGGGGPWWVFWAGLLNIEWVLVACLLHVRRSQTAGTRPAAEPAELVGV